MKFELHFEGEIIVVFGLNELLEKAIDKMYEMRRLPEGRVTSALLSNGYSIGDGTKFPILIAIGDSIFDYGIYAILRN